MNSNISKILICDDSILARKTLKAALTELGYNNFLEVTNGQDAVDLCEKEKPELILLDVVMPVKDGVTATKEIHALCPDTKIVIVSSVGTQTNITEALKAGACDFVQKPIDVDLLQQTIDNLKF